MRLSLLEVHDIAWVLDPAAGICQVYVWDNDPTYKMHNLKFYASIVLHKMYSYMQAVK